jgi:aminoglycoside 3-N-acetyltransferase I
MEEAVYLRRLNENDVESLRQLIGLFRMVFEENPNTIPSKDYHQKLLANPHFLAFCAFADQKVVGGITAYELQKYDQEASEIFVYDIAVHPDFHRKGLGKQLVEALTEYGKAHNVQVIFVGAHEEDQHALDFYQATGGKGEKVVLFNYQP